MVVRATRLAGRKILTCTEGEDRCARSGREKRAEALVNITSSAIKVFIYMVACAAILREVGVEIAPLLADTGTAGRAIGFGAQTLVKDFLTGFFILIENRCRVRDVAKIRDQAGLVEEVDLRAPISKGLEAVVHTIPNGELQSLNGMTHGWLRVVLNVAVACKETPCYFSLDFVKKMGFIQGESCSQHLIFKGSNDQTTAHHQGARLPFRDGTPHRQQDHHHLQTRSC